MFTFFTTIVYMNILIAVVSDEFEKVYDEQELALYKIRLPYIIKYWQHNESSIQVKNCVIVVPTNSEEKQEWTGWISVVKKQLAQTQKVFVEEMKDLKKSMIEHIDLADNKQLKKDTDIEGKIKEF